MKQLHDNGLEAGVRPPSYGKTPTASSSDAGKTSPYGDPITSLADLVPLDDDEKLEGYRDGYGGEPEPKGNRSRSYWHGWRNGATDAGHRPKDAAQAELARAYVAQSRRARAVQS